METMETLGEIRNSILAQINQQAVNTLVDELAKKAVEIQELKARLAALEKQIPTPPTS